MLRLNLSTRPFYNERAVTLGIAAVVLLTAALTMFNVAQIMSFNERNSELVSRAEASEARASELRAQAQATRQAMNREDVSEVSADARTANLLIDRRVFSWTDLFNRFEDTLPTNARILAVAPQTDNQGRMLVAITLDARSNEDRDAFIERLEDTGTFTGLLPRSDEITEDGNLRSVIQGYYVQIDRPATVSSPPASDSNEAGGNQSPQNATPGEPR
jgi:hypothetical protein